MTALRATRTWAQTVRLLLVGTVLVASAFRSAHATEIVQIVLDEAKIVKLPEKVATIVIGNPLIADVSIQPGNVAVLTGKGYGSTNVVALDRTGAVLMERTVEVRAARESVVVVYRGIQQETYSCTPHCQRRITLGDSAQFFEQTLGQTIVRAGQAQGAGQR